MRAQQQTTYLLGFFLASMLTALPLPAAEPEAAEAPLAEQLRAVETAFAKTMADRDHAAFAAFLAAETIFFAGNRELRGKEAVAAAWRPFFDGEEAPFSWQPEVASVLDSGQLGLTSGPVLDAAGTRVGTFNSVWRKKPEGGWEIVFDKGCPPCGG